MTANQVSRRNIRLLILLSAAVYFSSYLTRLNYSAVLVEMIASEHYTRSVASAALTGLFITYGAGQLLSGYLGDRTKPQLLIFAGLLVSAAMNLLIPLCPGTGLMTAVWCVNGLAQAMMWPPLVRILSELLSEADYKTATVRVSWGSSLATILIYLTAPLFIQWGGWRLIFFVCAVFALVMAFVWIFCFRKLESKMRANRLVPVAHSAVNGKGTGIPSTLWGVLALIMLAIVMQGLLRDGITTWMPSYISETFDLGSGISILTSVALPLFSLVTFQLTEFLNRHLLRNELGCACAIFAVGTIALLAPKFAGDAFAAAVACMTLAVGCMHGVNLLLICMVPPFFRSTGKTSLISGLLNSCTYIGSALSTYVIAVITDHFGWSATLLIWLLIASVGTLCCLLCIRRWSAYKSQNG